MHNQHKTTNQNIIKVIGLGLLLILMVIAYFNKKRVSTKFGIPFEKIDSIKSTKKDIQPKN